MNEKQIVAKLGKVLGILNALEILPKTKGCTTLIRDAKTTISEITADLTYEHKRTLHWVKVGDVILWLLKLYGCLKDYFKFCNFYLNIYKFVIKGN